MHTRRAGRAGRSAAGVAIDLHLILGADGTRFDRPTDARCVRIRPSYPTRRFIRRVPGSRGFLALPRPVTAPKPFTRLEDQAQHNLSRSIAAAGRARQQERCPR